MDPKPSTDDQSTDDTGINNFFGNILPVTCWLNVQLFLYSTKNTNLSIANTSVDLILFSQCFLEISVKICNNFTLLGFWMFTSQKDLIYESTTPPENFNGKKLVCSAHHGGRNFKRVKASVTLKIECEYKMMGVNLAKK